MEMIPVESSNVAAIGYAPEYNLMRVQFKDGALYDYPGITAEIHRKVMEAGSKGRAVDSFRHRAVKIEPATQTIQLREPAKPERSLMQVLDHDTCCTPKFSKAARTGALDNAESWTCLGCGVEYRPALIDGAVRHWVAHIYVELVSPR